MQDDYSKYFYEESRFNSEALDPEVYLIVGRRGSGKTSLTKYFNFQERFKHAHSIDIDEPEIYEAILQKLGNNTYLSPDLAINGVRKIWETLIWSIIFNEYSDFDTTINHGAIALEKKGKSVHIFRDVISGLLNKYVDVDGKVMGELTDLMTSSAFSKAKQKVLEFTPRRPVIIAIDTFERYDRENVAMMTVTASLIQCANSFNIAYASKGIHVKKPLSRRRYSRTSRKEPLPTPQSLFVIPCTYAGVPRT